MYKQICKIILLILCYNNLYSFTCDDITDKIKEIKDNQNLVLIIKYANTNIIIFEGLVTYAYIGNINAFVNYIKCDSQNNILYFENINNTNSEYSFSLNLDVEEVELNNNTNSEYSFPLNSDVEEVELKETFNTDRFLRFETMNQGDLDYNNLDKIKLDYINDLISNPKNKSYDIEPIIEDSEHDEEPHRGRKRSRSNEEPVESLGVRLPRVNNDVCSGACSSTAGSVQDSIDRNTSSSDDDSSSVEDSEHHEESHRGRKRSRSNEETDKKGGSQIVKKARLNDVVCSGTCSPTAESVQDNSLTDSNEDYLFGKEKLLPEVKKLIEEEQLFKDEYYVLERIKKKDEKSSFQQNRDVNLNFVEKNLQEGQSIVLLNCDLETQMQNFNNTYISIIIITKIGSSLYNLQYFIYSKQSNKFNKINNYQGDIIFGYKNRNHRGKYGLSINKHEILVENYYIIGELSIKKHANSMLGTLDDNPHTSTQKVFDSMDEVLRNIFKGHKYDENKVDEDNIRNRVDYLNNNISNSSTNETFVFVNDEYLSNPSAINNAFVTSTPGIVLEPMSRNEKNKLVFKVQFIEIGYYQSQFIIQDFANAYIKFIKNNNKINLRIFIKKTTHKDISLYKLLRMKLN